MISPFRPRRVINRITGEPIAQQAFPSKRMPPKKREDLPEVGPPEITLANAVAWIKAETLTKVRGPVSLPVIEARTEACLRCPHRGQKRRDPDQIGYCLVCGCGDSERGKLSRKITMRGVKRPKGCLWPDGDE